MHATDANLVATCPRFALIACGPTTRFYAAAAGTATPGGTAGGASALYRAVLMNEIIHTLGDE
jgi:hypothetical protein